MNYCYNCGDPSWAFRCKDCQRRYDEAHETVDAPAAEQPDLFDSDGNDPLG